MMVRSKEQTQSLYVHVYEALREDIIRGVLKPGEKLTEMKLAARLHTSRTPVREALRKLEQEGLVTFYALQGVEVASVSRDTLQHVYECRAVLEGLAARIVAQHHNDDELSGLEESVILAEQYVVKKDFDKVIEKNTVFHDTIISMSGNPVLIQMIGRLEPHILRYRNLTGSFGFREDFIDEHRRILELIEDGASEEAERMMTRHIQRDLAWILEQISLAEEL